MILQLFPPSVFVCPAHADPPKLTLKDLTVEERLVIQLYLRRRPGFAHVDTPGSLARDGSGEFEWADALTAESYARIVAVAPELRTRVEAGRQFRVDYVRAVLRRTEAYVFEEKRIDANVSSRIVGSYDAFVRAQNLRQEGKPDRQLIENNVRKQICTDYGYALGSSEASWAVEHQRKYRQMVDNLMDQKELRDPVTDLPEPLFKEWLKAERARLEEQLRMADDLLARKPWTKVGIQSDPFANPYVTALVARRVLALRKTLEQLKGADPRKQAELIKAIEGEVAKERAGAAQLVEEHFGGADRDDGSLTAVKFRSRAWLNDLDWDGKARRLESGEAVAPLWEYWLKRAQGSRGWWPFRRAPVEKVLRADEYRRKQREWWTQTTYKWGFRGAVAAAVITAGLSLYGHGMNILQGIAKIPSLVRFEGGGGGAGGVGREAPANGIEPLVTIRLPWTARTPEQERADAIKAEEQKREAEKNKQRQDVLSKLESREAPRSQGGGGLVKTKMGKGKNRSANNPAPEGDGEPVGVYRFIPKGANQLTDLPTEFELARREDMGVYRTLTNQPTKGDLAFEVETGAYHEPVDGLVAVPTPNGFDIRAEAWADGKRLAPGIDFEIIRAANGTVYLDLKGSFRDAQSVVYVAKYYPDPEAKLGFHADAAKLPLLSLTEVGWLSTLFREEGLIPISDALDAVLAKAIAEERQVRAEELVAVVRDESLYSYSPGEETEVQDSRNPLSAFRKYPRSKKGHIRFQCTGAAELTAAAINLVWAGRSEAQKAETRGMIVREPDEDTVHVGHRRVYVPDSHLGSVVLDPTPTKEDPESPKPKTVAASRKKEDEGRSAFERLLKRLAQAASAKRPKLEEKPPEKKEPAPKPEEKREVAEKPKPEEKREVAEKPKPVEPPKKELPVTEAAHAPGSDARWEADTSRWMQELMRQVFDFRFRGGLELEPETEEDRERARQERRRRKKRNQTKSAKTADVKKDPPPVVPEPPSDPVHETIEAPPVIVPVRVSPPRALPAALPGDDPARRAQIEAEILAIAQDELDQRRLENEARAEAEIARRRRENLGAANREQAARILKNRADAENEVLARRARNRAKTEAELALRRRRNHERDELAEEIATVQKALVTRAESLRLSNATLDYPHRRAQAVARLLKNYLTTEGGDPATLGEQLHELGAGDGSPVTSSADLAGRLTALNDMLQERGRGIRDAEVARAQQILEAKEKRLQRVAPKRNPLVPYVDERLMSSIDRLLTTLAGKTFTPRESVDYDTVLKIFQAKEPEDFDLVLSLFRARNPEALEPILAGIRAKNPEDRETVLREIRKQYPEDLAAIAREVRGRRTDCASVTEGYTG